MKQIPCIENKCLLYPLCMSKKSIDCTYIAEYHKYLRETYVFGYLECFEAIKKTLKEMHRYTTSPLPHRWRYNKGPLNIYKGGEI